MNRHKMNTNSETCVPSQKPRPFYWTNISAATRLEIETAIGKLKEEGKIEEIVETFAGGEIPEGWLSKFFNNEWPLVAMLLVLLPGIPFFIFFCYSMER